MTENELTSNEIEYLAWRLLAVILEKIDEEVIVADLHPGGGQYDCLALVTKQPKPLLMLNRNGISANLAGALIENIWEKALKNGIEETALFILAQANGGIDVKKKPEKNLLALTCRRIARWVRFQSQKKGKAVCCWIDDTYYVGPANALLSQVQVPEEWKKLPAPYPNSDWSAWLFALTVDDQVKGLVNMLTGDAIDTSGAKLEKWNEPLGAEAKLRKPLPRAITMPFEVPTDEVLMLFRKIGNFNGYQVFGDNLAEISEQIANQWGETGSLPDELDKLKGALFFIARKSRFTDHYPTGRELEFVKALGFAIDRIDKR